MKYCKLIVAAVTLVVTGNVLAQEKSYSNVVGHETLKLEAGINVLGVRFHESVEVSGNFETVTSNTAVDTEANFSTLSGVYVLEFESSNGQIQIVDIVNSSTELALSEDVTGAVTAPVDYSMRPISTISSVFGESNSAGLLAGGNSGAADQIWVPDPSAADGYAEYYFHTFFGSVPELRDVNTNAAVTALTVELPYDQGFVVRSSGTRELVVRGAVKTSTTSVTTTSGFNLIGSVYPIGATVESAFGVNNDNNVFVAGANPGASDQLWIPDVNEADGYAEYYFYTFFNSVHQLRSVDTNIAVDPSTVTLPSAIIIRSSFSSSGFNAPPSDYSSL